MQLKQQIDFPNMPCILYSNAHMDCTNVSPLGEKGNLYKYNTVLKKIKKILKCSVCWSFPTGYDFLRKALSSEIQSFSLESTDYTRLT